MVFKIFSLNVLHVFYSVPIQIAFNSFASSFLKFPMCMSFSSPGIHGLVFEIIQHLYLFGNFTLEGTIGEGYCLHTSVNLYCEHPDCLFHLLEKQYLDTFEMKAEVCDSVS